MSTTLDLLRELDAADFDTWGEQDKGPGVQPLATPEEVTASSEAVFDHPWDDPARFPECLRIAFDALGVIAIGNTEAAQGATQAMRRMVQRAVSGVPMNEPSGEDL